MALLSAPAQLAAQSAASEAAPASANPPSPVVSVWGGARDSIILLADGSVWTWGANECDPVPFGVGPCGKLGDGSTLDRHVPTQVHAASNIGHLGSIVAIMGGEMHNFALRSDGTVWAWGANYAGQLGTGNFENSDVPVQVSGLISVTALGGRGYHSLAVRSDGTVWAWGWNRHGELGHDTTGQPCASVLSTTTCSTVPVQVNGIANPLMVTGGGFFSLALMPDHTVMGWGQGSHGELGDGAYSDEPAPVHASAVLSHVVQISAGWFHALALTDDGHVWAWGDNVGGEIGTGVSTTTGISVPFEVPGLDNVARVSAGDGFSGALENDGTVWTWGGNAFGQLGDGTFNDRASPAQVHNLGSVKLYAARDYHDIAVLEDGTVWDWGSNENGELGNNTVGDSAVPVEVIFPVAAPPQWGLWLPFLAR